MTRWFLRAVSRLLVGVLLFAQLAIAAYACPQLLQAATGTTMVAASVAAEATPGADATTAADDRAPHCDGVEASAAALDPALPNLCAEHCRYGQQSDQTATMTLPAALLALRYVTPLVPAPVAAPQPARAATRVLAATVPPHAILHCCFRI